MKKKPLGLYIHIPFCRSKCSYCDFYSLAANSPKDAAMDQYLAALSRHLEESAATGLAETYLVDTVYFGGGTPSYLGCQRLKKLLRTVARAYSIAPGAEITLEANPDSLGSWREVRALRRAGINRISLGVQSADDGELRAIGRPHTFAQAEEAVAAARRGGLENLSLDLIYGLPGQALEGWKRTLERTVALEPEHLSCYGLKVEKGTPLWERRETADLPDDDQQADMYLWSVEYLAQQGYRQYEISNFARPGYASRHNLKYWTLGEYAGFGPGAHSDLGGVRYAFVRDLQAYCQGTDILAEREPILPRERCLEYLMLGLRTVEGISGKDFEACFHLPFAQVESVLERCRAAGYAVYGGERWHLTPEGFLVSNQVIGQALDALAQTRQQIFSMKP